MQKAFRNPENPTSASTGYEMVKKHSRKVMQYKKKLNNSQITQPTTMRVVYFEPT